MPPRLLPWLLALLVAAPAGSQELRTPGDTPLQDLLQIIELRRDVVVQSALGGRGPNYELDLDEKVLWRATRGRVAVVLTNRRMLAVGTGSGSWQRERFEIGESFPYEVLLGDRVAMLWTSKRLLAFDSNNGNLIEEDLGPRERVRALEIGANVGVMLTDRRAIGFSPTSGGFREIKVQLRERFHTINATSTIVTLHGNRRLLTFRGPVASWGERNLDLR